MLNELLFEYIPYIMIAVGFGIFGFTVYEAVQLGFFRYKETYEKNIKGDLQKNFMPYSSEHFFKLNILSTLGMAIVGYLLLNSWLFCFVFLVAGYYLPKIFIKYTAMKRAEKLELQLIDALHVLANSVSAGLTLPQACEVVVSQLTPPVSQEFGLLVNEHRLGVPFDKSMENMAIRLKSNNFDLLVTAIVIARQTGGNVSQIFKQLAESIKEIMRLEGKVKALTAQGKAQGYILAGLPFALAGMLSVISPEMITPLFNTPQGAVILFIALIFWLIGVYLVRKVINVDI